MEIEQGLKYPNTIIVQYILLSPFIFHLFILVSAHISDVRLVNEYPKHARVRGSRVD
jgi:hypothetical protein